METELPEYIEKVPFCTEWVKYKGEIYFAMINFEKSFACHRAIIDLCYCATAGLINGRVMKSVNYYESEFEVQKLM